MFQKINNPIIFQGSLKKKNYFEGWYYKMVSADKNYSLALIPGISLNKDNSHVFIQVFLTYKKTELKTKYIVYKTGDFITEKNPFKLSIKNNIFSENDIKIAIDDQDISVIGDLKFIDNTKIKTSIMSPSIMGIFSYIKFMECYHGVISMSHRLEGKLNINNTMVDFTGGMGYIEKDWGRSFPQSYVWMQSNHFKDNKTSFMFSEATIPFLGFKFHGLIVNLIVSNKEYRFATYNLAKVIKKDIQSNQVHYEIKKRRYIIMIKAINDKTISLPSPKNGSMTQSIKEGLSGIIKIELFENNKLIYSDEGTHAGLEIMMK